MYLDANARLLTELSPQERPNQLVIIDGTWYQAKTIVRDVAQLQKLPCYRFAPSSPGQYRIRREPNAQSLSTLEATVAALRTLEPDTPGWDQLLAAFNQMVEKQLEHSAGYVSWRKKQNRRSRPRFIPLRLLQDPTSVVVAYGEATPGKHGLHIDKPLPVNWVAQRLGTAEQFACRLQQKSPLPTSALEFMQLSATDFEGAISANEFRRNWSRFLRRNDVLVVYHQRIYQLLKNMDAERPQCIVLKSIFGKWQRGFHSVEELAGVENVVVTDDDGRSRADRRLELAVALVEHLRRASIGSEVDRLGTSALTHNSDTRKPAAGHRPSDV
ncbi:MAG: DTW domain-containing protein [Planctomycetaceae bacterium]|nr:DTW domain-containing protein [Planctomycetaceae bacterium]